MATSATSFTIHAPTPRPASSVMLNVLSTLSNASVQASQPPKPSVAGALRTRTYPNHLQSRQILRDKTITAIHGRIEASKNAGPFSSSPRRRGRRSTLTTAPRRVPLSPTVALHNAERRTNLIPTRERAFRTRPRPAARGKRILSKVPTLLENEVCHPPAAGPAPPVLYPMVRTKASRPHPRTHRPAKDENTIPFPSETLPALPSALPKARGRTVRAVSYSIPRAPFTQLSQAVE